MPQRILRREMLLTLPALAVAPACAELAGEVSTEAHFRVKYDDDGEFFGWSEITIQDDTSGVESATLVRVFLKAEEGHTDVTFIETCTGEAVTPDARTVLAEGKDFPKDDTLAPMTIVHTGDIKPFFPDGHTIRLEWTGKLNPNFTAWPEEGIRVGVYITVEVNG